MTFLGHFHLGPKKPESSTEASGTPPPERGRPLRASGRGGAGNMHHQLAERDVTDENAIREQLYTVHVGRGGAGNVRSPSRDPLDRQRHEDEKIRALEQQGKLQSEELSHVQVTGRGGRGNIPHPNTDIEHSRGRSMSPSSVLRSLSRSRSASREPGPSRREKSVPRVPVLDRVREAV